MRLHATREFLMKFLELVYQPMHVIVKFKLNCIICIKLLSLCIVKIVTPCTTDFDLLAGPWWDGVAEKYEAI